MYWSMSNQETLEYLQKSNFQEWKVMEELGSQLAAVKQSEDE